MNEPPTSTGIVVGQKIPAFQAPDQNGTAQDFNSINGPKGAVLYFMRSADW
jgi:peroxiredoxin